MTHSEEFKENKKGKKKKSQQRETRRGAGATLEINLKKSQNKISRSVSYPIWAAARLDATCERRDEAQNCDRGNASTLRGSIAATNERMRQESLHSDHILPLIQYSIFR
jgi:hypothetical protein